MIRVRLSTVLEQRSMSLRELARRTGTHPDVLSRFARHATGGVSYQLLDRICSELDCTVADLIEYQPSASQTELFE